MISPWMVGRTGTLEGLDLFYTNVNTPDLADCAARGIDYQPCVLPGDLSSGARRHGDYYWRSLYNMVRLGSHGLYVSMFDEFNEGNQIAKTAETSASVPSGSGIRALDEDGTFCSSDYYLRITADGGHMLKGQIPLTANRPTQPSIVAVNTDLARGKSTSESSHTQVYGSGNITDGNPSSYWESANNAFPQWVQVDLGASVAVARVVLSLPPSWEARTQTLALSDGGSGRTLVGPATYRFDPASGNAVTVAFPAAQVRFVRATMTANTGWPAGQVASFEAYGS
jgi:hypothetical protein